MLNDNLKAAMRSRIEEIDRELRRPKEEKLVEDWNRAKLSESLQSSMIEILSDKDLQDYVAKVGPLELLRLQSTDSDHLYVGIVDYSGLNEKFSPRKIPLENQLSFFSPNNVYWRLNSEKTDEKIVYRSKGYIGYLLPLEDLKAGECNEYLKALATPGVIVDPWSVHSWIHPDLSPYWKIGNGALTPQLLEKAVEYSVRKSLEQKS